MTFSEKVLATADDRDDARELARSLPRPNMVRQADDGSWMVLQLLPAKWVPAAVHKISA